MTCPDCHVVPTFSPLTEGEFSSHSPQLGAPLLKLGGQDGQ